MRQPKTADDAERSLTTKQAAAVDLLALGQTVGETAKTLKVARQTLSRWLHHDAAFQAAVTERRNESLHASAGRLLGVLPKAIDCLEAAVAVGDTKAAGELLRASGLRQAMPTICGVTPEQAASLAPALAITINLTPEPPGREPIDVTPKPVDPFAVNPLE